MSYWKIRPVNLSWLAKWWTKKGNQIKNTYLLNSIYTCKVQNYMFLGMKFCLSTLSSTLFRWECLKKIHLQQRCWREKLHGVTVQYIPTSVLPFFITQVSEDAMKEKNEIIGRLEDKTNQINATMKQLEQRYRSIFVFLHSFLHPFTFTSFPRSCHWNVTSN